MANRVHDSLGVQLRYVVANPSSYAYPDSTRPVPVKDIIDQDAIDFRLFDGRACERFNWWPYGLAERRGYAGKTSADKLRQQWAARPTTYLLGEGDVRPIDGFDASCAAMAQGGDAPRARPRVCRLRERTARGAPRRRGRAGLRARRALHADGGCGPVGVISEMVSGRWLRLRGRSGGDLLGERQADVAGRVVNAARGQRQAAAARAVVGVHLLQRCGLRGR